MIGLDTNVLVRYLVRDDRRQAERASSYIQEAASKGEYLFINCMVFCELVWVLEACYDFTKDEIVNVLQKILVTKQFEFEQKDIIRKAVSDYANGKGDLSDYLIGIVNHQHGCIRTATFDNALKNAANFEILGGK